MLYEQAMIISLCNMDAIVAFGHVLVPFERYGCPKRWAQKSHHGICYMHDLREN